jgi:hypothetical protein
METRLRPESEDEDEDLYSTSGFESDSELEREPGFESEFDLSGEHTDDDDDDDDQRASTGSGDGASAEGSVVGPKNDDGIYQERLYDDGLEHLRTELEKKYSIDQISSTLAADVNCTERNPPSRRPSQENFDNGPLSLLADRRAVQYGESVSIYLDVEAASPESLVLSQFALFSCVVQTSYISVAKPC